MTGSVTTPEWLDGRLLDSRSMDASDPTFAASAPSAHSNSLSCYTTARVTAGRALHLEHHVHRLQRDARSLGLGEFDPSLISRACEELGRAVFGDESGIVRIEARRGSDPERASLHATTRPIGLEKDTWSALTAPTAHHGPLGYRGAKIMNNQLYEEARIFSAAARVDEALLFDAAGLLVEGARTNLLIVSADGRLASPDLALGAVAGIALEIVSQHVPDLTIAEIRADDVANARELIALNAVRGACPITQVDGRAICASKPGPWAERLDSLLSG